MDRDWVGADACTLPTLEQPLRVVEFGSLFRSSVREVHRWKATRLRLVLTGPADLLSRVQDLTDREAACCSFFTFSLTTAGEEGPETSPSATRLHLDIAVPAEHTDVLDAIAERAHRIAVGSRA